MRIRDPKLISDAGHALADAMLSEWFLGWSSCDEASGTGFAPGAETAAPYPTPTRDEAAMRSVLQAAPRDWEVSQDTVPDYPSGRPIHRGTVATPEGISLHGFDTGDAPLALGRTLLSAFHAESITADSATMAQLFARLNR